MRTLFEALDAAPDWIVFAGLFVVIAAVRTAEYFVNRSASGAANKEDPNA